MNKLQVAARLGLRFVHTSARGKGPVSMKEPYAPKGDGSAGGTIPAKSGYQNVLRLQKLWSIEDGTMVWQKKGIDTVSYNLTLISSGAAVLYCFYLIGQMSFPKKAE